MRKLLKPLLAAMILTTAMAMPAEAKRRGFGFVRMPTGETIVKVKDLPDTEVLRREDGKYIDLGYYFKATGGEWVGYVGSDSQYIKLDESQLKTLLALGGVSKLPPVPSRPASSAAGAGFTWIFVAIGALVILFKIFNTVMGVVRGGRRVVNSIRGSKPAAEVQFSPSASIDDRIAQAAAAYQSAATAQPAFGAARSSFGQAQAGSFGRR
jgi:hypothetical protein